MDYQTDIKIGFIFFYEASIRKPSGFVRVRGKHILFFDSAKHPLNDPTVQSINDAQTLIEMEKGLEPDSLTILSMNKMEIGKDSLSNFVTI